MRLLVLFLIIAKIIVTKYLTRSNLSEGAHISAHSLRVQPILVWRAWW